MRFRCRNSRGVTRVGERAATVMVGPNGARFVAMTVLISTFGNSAAAILAGARLLFAMALDGVFFRSAARVHPRYRTPHIAVVALAAWSAALALSGSYEQLFTYVMFASILLHMIGGLAVFRLRRTQPDRPRPYRVWGYPVVPIIFIARLGGVRDQYAAGAAARIARRPRPAGAGLARLLVFQAMRFAILGSGAVGGYYGARLAHAGHDVTFIARGAHLAAIRDRGLQVQSSLGDFLVRSPAEEDPSRVGPVDAIIVSIKAYDNPTALPLIDADARSATRPC